MQEQESTCINMDTSSIHPGKLDEAGESQDQADVVTTQETVPDIDTKIENEDIQKLEATMNKLKKEMHHSNKIRYKMDKDTKNALAKIHEDIEDIKEYIKGGVTKEDLRELFKDIFGEKGIKPNMMDKLDGNIQGTDANESPTDDKGKPIADNWQDLLVLQHVDKEVLENKENHDEILVEETDSSSRNVRIIDLTDKSVLKNMSGGEESQCERKQAEIDKAESYKNDKKRPEIMQFLEETTENDILTSTKQAETNNSELCNYHSGDGDHPEHITELKATEDDDNTYNVDGQAANRIELIDKATIYANATKAKKRRIRKKRAQERLKAKQAEMIARDEDMQKQQEKDSMKQIVAFQEKVSMKTITAFQNKLSVKQIVAFGLLLSVLFLLDVMEKISVIS